MWSVKITLISRGISFPSGVRFFWKWAVDKRSKERVAILDGSCYFRGIVGSSSKYSRNCHRITQDIDRGVYDEVRKCLQTTCQIKREGSLCSEGLVKGYVMNKELQISSRCDFVPEEAEGSMEVSASDGDDAVIASDGAENSSKQKSQKRRGQPIMEGDAFVFDNDAIGMRDIVPVSVKGRCTLDKIYKLNKRLESHHREAIEGAIFKPILEY
ncbi:hypothetical protein Cgig2_021319 [Carnegiea gigantea]|uniref:Uncharacterized protein n=1 Tax=Carnegiea gigantea TaxID=171969 RepID=A0A9Q1JFE9_9CARY|nr:hypothetical protein Cgig2_021319 [Carnegiea gigantea]